MAAGLRGVGFWLRRYTAPNRLQVRPRLCTELSRGVSPYSTKPSTCQKCGKPMDQILCCPHCKTIQNHSHEINYYDLFGISKNYSVETAALKSKFFKLQTQMHPDKSINATEGDKALFEQYSSLINEAYETLSDPLKRGLYLMKMKGIEIEENITQSDFEFLSEVMKFNEDLESVESPDGLRKLEHENKENIRSLSKDIELAFTSNDLEVVKVKLAKLKYYYSNNDRIKKKKIELHITD